MEFFDVVNTRRSVRKYHPTPVPEEVIQTALDAALLAPNSSNMQPWEFYWVRSAETRKELVDACFKQLAARTAGELIVVVARSDNWRRNQTLMLAELTKRNQASKAKTDYYKKVVPLAYVQGPLNLFGFVKILATMAIGWFRPVPRGPFSKAELFNVLTKSTALACENFMLAVTAQGFATCPMEGFDEVRVKRLLQLNRRCRVVMVISVGEPDPDGTYGDRIRFDRNLFVHEV